MIFSTVRFWLTAGLLLSVMGTVQVLSALRDSQTWDEAFELGAGYNYWKTGVYRFNLEQPPVGKLISAFPLLFVNLSIPVDHPSYTKPDDVDFGHEFLYRNRLPADRILFMGRLGTIALTLLFGLTLALWSRKKFGEPSALLALMSATTTNPPSIASASDKARPRPDAPPVTKATFCGGGVMDVRSRLALVCL